MSASDGGDDGGLVILPTAGTTIPTWVYRLQPLAPVAGALAGVAGFLVAFAKDPVGFVVMVIRSFIIGSVLQAGAYITNTILAGFEIITGALTVVQRTLVGAFAVVGIDILDALVGVQESVSRVVAGAGPAGPLIAVLAVSVSLWVMYRIAVAGLELVPGGSSVLTLLGLR